VTHFVLVHGAWHGSWCWERLVPELVSRGHRATAVDVAFHDGNLSLADHARAVAEDCPDEEFALVGHSLGAAVVPIVAALRPAAAVVMVCGVIPNLEGMPWDDAPEMGRPGIYATVEEPDGSTRWPSRAAATAAFYAQCVPADAAWAFSMLTGLDTRSLWDRPYPLTEWPETRFAAVAAEDDAAITLDYQAQVLPRRLGITPTVMPGDHSPYLSHPAHLAVALGDATS